MDFNFAEYYKRISDTDLLDILDNAGDYQPLALEAANKELTHRQLSQTEIEAARSPLLAIQLRKEEQREKGKALEQKMKAMSESIFNSVKPHDTKEDATNKIILLVIVVYGLYFITSLPGFVKIFVFNNFPDFTVRFLLFLLPVIIIPLALLTFWKRKSVGWTLLVLCVTFTIVADLVMFYGSFTLMGYRSYRSLQKIPIKASDIFQLFIHLSTLFILCRNNIRDIYKVDVHKMSGIIFIGAVVSFIVIWTNL